MSSIAETYGPLLETVSFAARAHDGQCRKDRRTPYASHVFRVCLVLRHVFGVEDARILTAALLHDTIEDTRTDLDDVLELLGPAGSPVGAWVAALTKDKRRPHDEREQAYRDTLAAAPWQVQLCKLADLFDNLLDSRTLDESHRQRSLRKSREVHHVLRSPSFPEEDQARAAPLYERAWSLVGRLLDEISVG